MKFQGENIGGGRGMGLGAQLSLGNLFLRLLAWLLLDCGPHSLNVFAACWEHRQCDT